MCRVNREITDAGQVQFSPRLDSMCLKVYGHERQAASIQTMFFPITLILGLISLIKKGKKMFYCIESNKNFQLKVVIFQGR